DVGSRPARAIWPVSTAAETEGAWLTPTPRTKWPGYASPSVLAPLDMAIGWSDTRRGQHCRKAFRDGGPARDPGEEATVGLPHLRPDHRPAVAVRACSQLGASVRILQERDAGRGEGAGRSGRHQDAPTLSQQLGGVGIGG